MFFGPLAIDVLGLILPCFIAAWLLLLVGFIIYKRVNKRRVARHAWEPELRVYEEPPEREVALRVALGSRRNGGYFPAR